MTRMRDGAHILVGSWMVVGILVLASFTPVASSAPESRLVRVAFTEEMLKPYANDVRDMQAALEAWADKYVGGRGTGLRAEVRLLENVEDAQRRLKSQSIDLLVLSGLDYVQRRQTLPVLPVCMTMAMGKVSDSFVVLTRKASGIRTLAQLKGRKLLIRRGYYSKLTRTWLDTLLWRQGLPGCDTFFTSISGATRINQAVLPVFFGQVDACCVPLEGYRTMVELNPQLGEELVTVATSPSYLSSVVCFRKQWDAVAQQKVLQLLLDTHRSANGQQVLMLFKFERLVPFHAAEGESLIRLLKEHERMRSRRLHGSRNT